MEDYNDIQMMEIRHPRECKEDECTKNTFQHAEVSLPVEIKVETKLEDIEVECVGEPKVFCRDSEHDKCEITIKQKLCIKIPITYKVKVCKGEERIFCEMHGMCCE